MLGKIMVLEEARARFSREPLYDLIVVDAPATGHGLAFLKVPLAASPAVPVGPIGHNARRILDAAARPDADGARGGRDPRGDGGRGGASSSTALAADEVGIEPQAVVLNACHERRFSDADEAEVLRLAAAEADGRPRARRAAAGGAARRAPADPAAQADPLLPRRGSGAPSTRRSCRCPSCSARRWASTSCALLADALEAA